MSPTFCYGWGLWAGTESGLLSGMQAGAIQDGACARTESSLLPGAGPERWGGVTLLLSMRDRAKKRGQRAEAVVSSLLLRMGKEPWGRCLWDRMKCGLLLVACFHGWGGA